MLLFFITKSQLQLVVDLIQQNFSMRAKKIYLQVTHYGEKFMQLFYLSLQLEIQDANMFYLKETLLILLKPSKKIQKTQTRASVESLMMPNLSYTLLKLGILFMFIEKQFCCVHNLASQACASNSDGPISISSIPNWLFVSEDGLGHSVVSSDI